MSRIRGLRGLVHDAIDAITTLVEDTQREAAARTVAAIDALTPAGEAVELVERARGGVAQGVFETIRLVNRTVEKVGDGAEKALTLGAQKLALDPAALGISPELLDRVSPAIDALEAGLNAVLGDYLAARDNALAIGLGVYVGGKRIGLDRASLAAAFPGATGKLAVLVHGLGCTEQCFNLFSRDHYGEPGVSYGSQLAGDLGFTPVFIRYNTGRHISENGRALSALLGELCAAFPVPVQQLVLVGHSMGGLVSRSAAHYGGRDSARWVAALSHVVCIGSPHHGAPLEQMTNVLSSVLSALPTAGTQVPAKILNARSAGVKDLRFGYITDEDWTGKDPDAVLKDERSDVPMLEHVTYAFVAGCVGPADGPFAQLIGDLLVRVPSGSGLHEEETRHIQFQAGEVLVGLDHMALINHPSVYTVLKRLLGEPRLPPSDGELSLPKGLPVDAELIPERS
jgi:triacylglycerol lipase